MSERTSPWIKGAVGLIWILTVLAVYYIFHKPVDPGLALHLLALVWRGIVVLWVILWAAALGSRLFAGDGLRGPAAASLQTAFGLGILSLVILLLGSLGWLNRWSVSILLIAGLIGFRENLPGWFARWRDPLWSSDDLAVRWVRPLLYGLLVVLLIYALAPPLKFDSLVYHLVLPEQYLAQGKVDYQDWLMFSGMPQLVEMNFSAVIALAGVSAAPLLGWAAGVLALLGMMAWLAQHFGIRTAWIAGVILISGYTTALSLAWGYAEWWALWFGLGTLALLSPTAGRHQRRPLVYAALFAGFALSTKYSAGVVLVAGCVLLVVSRVRLGSWRVAIQRALFFGAIAALVSIPWWLKNYAGTGNPFYPFIFSGGAMTELRLGLYQGLAAWGGWREVLTLPWQVTMMGREGAPGPGASLGPLLLSFGVLAVLGWRQRSAQAATLLGSSLIFSFVGLLLWAGLSRVSGLLIQTRLYTVLFPAFVALAAAGFDAWAKIRWPGVRLSRIALTVVVLVLGLNLIQTSRTVLASQALPTVLGLTNERDHLRHNLGMYALVMESIDELPPESQVLMLWEPRSLSCRPRCTPDEVLDRWAVDYATHGSRKDVLDDWQRQGFTHLLVFDLGLEAFADDGRFDTQLWAELDLLLNSLDVATDFEQVYTLYEISP